MTGPDAVILYVIRLGNAVERKRMNDTPGDSNDGYRVFVRTVSVLIVSSCILFAVSLYLFKVGIIYTYFAGSHPTTELLWIGIALVVACYFSLSGLVGKFLWFLSGEKRAPPSGKA